MTSMNSLVTLSGPNVEFAERLQKLRSDAGLSQSELASRAGVSLDSLRNWEQGRVLPRIDTAAKLARALGVSVDALVENGGTEAKPAAAKRKGKKG